MSDFVARVARANKELAALKAGFAGGEKQFYPATVTQQTFNIYSGSPLLIRVGFAKQDFPQLYTFINVTGGGPGLFIRKNFYEWRCRNALFTTITVDCVLLSQEPPTSFTIEATT